MPVRRARHWFCLLLLALPYAAAGETGYIIDRVEVGMYESASPDSPILKLLPTGTEVEILERDGALARVREPGGVIGWIDKRYLMGAKPTRQLLNEAEAELTRLRRELDTARQQLARRVTPAADVTAELEKLEQVRDNLQAQLAVERQRVSEFRGQLAALREQLQEMRSGEATDERGFIDTLRQSFETGRELWIVLAVIFLIGLALGIFLIDYLNRRRHGGFRV